jgi:hypothetical protein
MAEKIDLLSQVIQHLSTIFSVLFPYGIFKEIGDGAGLEQGEGA